jgi:transcriptional regulator with XRE-family HTH domain
MTTVTRSGPHRRQLATELRRLREQADFTQFRVAEHLEWSPSKVIRIEQGKVRVAVTDLRALLALYEVSDPQTIEYLSDLARESRSLPFTAYRGIVSDETLEFFQLEVAASIIRQVALNVVPGIMQTDDYAQAIFEAFDVERSHTELLLDSRHERRAALERAAPPKLSIVMDEAVIRRTVGGSGVMTKQLDYLVDLAARPNISLQVLPFALGASAVLAGSFTHLELTDNPLQAIFVETPVRDALRVDTEEVETYLRRFHALERVATVPNDFERFVRG